MTLLVKIKNTNKFFQSKENHHLFLEQLYKKFEFNNLEEWKTISRRKLKLNGGRSLIENYYANDFQRLLTTIYPNFPWTLQISSKKNSHQYFSKIENQRKYMDKLFLQLNLFSLDEFLNVKKKYLKLNGGTSLIDFYYSNDMQKLLSAIYPNFPWPFQNNYLNNNNNNIINNNNLNDNINNILINNDEKKELHQKLIENLYIKLKLKSLEEWEKITIKTMKKKGAKEILDYYFDDLEKLFSNIYPNYPWQFNQLKSKISFEKQCDWMDKMFAKFQLNSLEDWMKISRSQIILNGGRSILYGEFSHDYHKMLSTIYPNFPWPFSVFPIENNKKNLIFFFKSIENQKIFMNYLFKKLNLNKLNDWLGISRNQIILNGGKILLLNYYANDMKELLRSIYPNHQWKFDLNNKNVNNIKEYFQSLKNQRKFMDELSIKFLLNSKDDWLKISRKQIKINGGLILLNYYENNMQKLLSSVYPEHHWKFEQLLLINSKEYFKSIENQKNFMNDLFNKFKLNSLDEWIQIPKKQIKQQIGGKIILKIYSENLSKLLFTIFPLHNWKKSLRKNHFKILRNQQKILENIEKKLKINQLNDWMKITKNQLLIHGGKTILEFYSNDLEKLLVCVYPHHHWPFLDKNSEINLKFRPNLNYFQKSIEFNRKRLKKLIEKFAIKQKKDWFRISAEYQEIKVYSSLKLIYPNEKWNKKLFQFRVKKTKQRLLYAKMNSIFPQHLILEDYRKFTFIPLELDIYIPSLNMALEFQGEQHFNDIPSGFQNLESYQSNDKLKIELVDQVSIKLVLIPYWWDLSISTLMITLRAFLNHLFCL